MTDQDAIIIQFPVRHEALPLVDIVDFVTSHDLRTLDQNKPAFTVLDRRQIDGRVITTALIDGQALEFVRSVDDNQSEE